VTFVSLKAHSPAVADGHDRPDANDTAPAGRASTGLGELDRLLSGGLPVGRSTLVCGRAGTGKTTLGLQFLAEGIRLGEPGLLALVDQKPRHLTEDARALGWDLDEWTRAKMLRLLDASPYFAALGKTHTTPSARDITSDLAGQLKASGARRLVIDPVTSLVWEDSSAARVREFLRTLIFALEDNLGVTSLLIAPHTDGPLCASSIAEQLATGVIELSVDRRSQEWQRSLSVTKMRGTAVEPTRLNVRIANGRGLLESTNEPP
jgi:circadian clock protein KaiC